MYSIWKNDTLYAPEEYKWVKYLRKNFSENFNPLLKSLMFIVENDDLIDN